MKLTEHIKHSGKLKKKRDEFEDGPAFGDGGKKQVRPQTHLFFLTNWAFRGKILTTMIKGEKYVQ